MNCASVSPAFLIMSFRRPIRIGLRVAENVTNAPFGILMFICDPLPPPLVCRLHVGMRAPRREDARLVMAACNLLVPLGMHGFGQPNARHDNRLIGNVLPVLDESLNV